MTKVRIGIIGLGNIAQKVYLPFLSTEKDWILTGAYSPTEAKRIKICNQYRVHAFSSLPDLFDSSDAVFVSSSTNSHFEVVAEALKRGKDVYVDKPLASTSDAAEQLAELSVKYGRKLMVGFNRRFAPMYVQAKKANINASLIRIEKHRIDSIRQEDYKITLLDDYIHLIDTARWLGEPDSYSSVKGSIQISQKNELIFAQHHYRSNNIGVFIDMHRKAGTDLERLELITEDSIIRVNNMDTVEVEKNGKIETGISPAWDTIIKRKGFEDAIIHFITSVLGNTQPIVDAQEGLKSQKLFDYIVKQSVLN